MVLNPARLYRAVKRRVRKWHDSQLSTHARSAQKAITQSKLVIADMDWYGYSNIDLSQILAENLAIGERFCVQKIPRAAVFSFLRDSCRIRRVWIQPAGPETATYRGFKLWEICKASVIKELGYNPGNSLDESERLLVEQFYNWAVLCLDGLEKALDDIQPYAVVAFQGGHFDSRCIVESAARRGIRTIAVETSFIGDHALVDSLSGIIINRHSLAFRGSSLYEVLAQDQSLDVLAFWRDSLARKNQYHRTGGQELASLGLPSGKKLILVIGQVAVDASITLDSPLYQSPADLISDMVGIARCHPDWHVVARLHPNEAAHIDTRNDPEGPGTYLWDNTLRDLERRGVLSEPNLTVIAGTGINTYELIARADVGVTINSQAGLEMGLLGKPVVTTGRCFYARNGFTWDVGRRELLEAAVDNAMQRGITPEETTRLHEFCRYLFWHYLLPLDARAASKRAHRLQEILGVAGP